MENVVTVIKKGDRIMLVKLVIGGNIVYVISAYAPQVELDDQTKRDFESKWMRSYKRYL